MSFDPAQIRRWMANQEAAKQAERDLVQAQGQRPGWSIETALSLINALEGRQAELQSDPLREQSEASVRATWARLRLRLLA